jgi:DNA repair photolyase
MSEQLSLFENSEPEGPNKLGQAAIEYRSASAILTPASGFVSSYDYTLNPYSGCAFGCSYCYAAFFSRDRDLQDRWGYWVRVKENALALLSKKRRSSVEGKRIYMSSVTDPYQPIEQRLELTRHLLEQLVPLQPRLVVQTRSPLVTRDIDLFKQFNVVQVNMTITTDSERVRKAFEPLCPSNQQRLKAIAEVSASGVNSCITMTPLLPIEDPVEFARTLSETGVKMFVVQPFHETKSSRFVAGTGEQALKLTAELQWTNERYREAVEILKRELPDLREGKEGFASI